MVHEGGQVRYRLIVSVSFFVALLSVDGLIDAHAQSKPTEDKRPLIRVIVEYIKVEQLDYSDWLLKNRLEHDATELHATAQKWVNKGRGKIIETVIRTAISGQRGKVRSQDDYVYPSEFDRPKIPGQVALSGKTSAPVTSMQAAAFKTRKLGITLKVDPILASDQVTIDLNLAPEIVELKGETQWPSQKERDATSIKMPIFHSIKIITQVATFPGRYYLLGTSRPRKAVVSQRGNPLILQFVRADFATTKGGATRP